LCKMTENNTACLLICIKCTNAKNRQIWNESREILIKPHVRQNKFGKEPGSELEEPREIRQNVS